VFGPFPFSVTDQKVDLIEIAEVLLFDLPLTLKEPCVGMLDTCHGLDRSLLTAARTYWINDR
jgi:hypothetical protein